MENLYYPFVNEPLPYAYNALEPWIDEKTMHLHHDRHLQAYIDQLNALLEANPVLQRFSLLQLIRQVGRLPKPLQIPIRNQAGGVYNQRFFFEGMEPAKGQEPGSQLAELLQRDFGGQEAFQKAFQQAALNVFGSGYAWLVWDRGWLRIMTTPNQNCPLEQKTCPLLTLDVWEHAYYLKHYNVRAAYIEDWFRLIRWEAVEERLWRAKEI